MDLLSKKKLPRFCGLERRFFMKVTLITFRPVEFN